MSENKKTKAVYILTFELERDYKEYRELGSLIEKYDRVMLMKNVYLILFQPENKNNTFEESLGFLWIELNKYLNEKEYVSFVEIKTQIKTTKPKVKQWIRDTMADYNKFLPNYL